MWWFAARLALGSPGGEAPDLEPVPVEEASADKAAELLDMDPEFLRQIQVGLEQIYLRRYDESLVHFAKVEEAYPGTGLAALSETVVWQARMLENFDNRHEKQYEQASRRARKELEAALEVEGNDAWEHLASAALVGMEAIYAFRQKKYINAVSLAFNAMGHIEASRKAAPDFVDLRLADGMYLYWRTIVTERSSMLPDFGDHKAEGIAAMEDVEKNGVFIRPLATLALAFSFVEDGENERAEIACERNRQRYPDNVVNNLMTAMVRVKRKKYDEAVALVDKVHATDPTNVYGHYWRGVARLKQRRYDEAESSFETFLASPHLEKYQEASAHWRLGQLHEHLDAYDEAVDHYQRAVKVDSHKSSKAALDRLKEQKKDGEIDY